MSTTQWIHRFYVDNVLTDAAGPVLAADASNAYGVKRLDTGAVVVPAGTAFTRQSQGVYVLAWTDPAPGLRYSLQIRTPVAGGGVIQEEQILSGPTPGSPAPPGAVFHYVPALGNTTKARLGVVLLHGVKTQHGQAQHDRGRLYGNLTKSGASYTLALYRSTAKLGTDLVALGTVPDVGTYFDLAEQNASGLTGRALVGSYTADDTDVVVVATLAVDADVIVDQSLLAGLAHATGYDPAHGCAQLHATAMQTVLTEGLPGACPHLFPGGTGFATFVPNLQAAGDNFPDLRKLANPDQLRVAQAHLVKALLAEQQEHLEEFAAIAAAARKRYEQALLKLEAMNKPADAVAAVDAGGGGISVGTWTRG